MTPRRCPWCGDDPLYVAYHDAEWGVAERDGRALWEKLILDGFQAGLSWITILRKREGFRDAFEGFDPVRIARYGEADVARLMADARIVRHRGKIEATIGNAQACLAMGGADAFGAWCWAWVDGAPLRNRPATMRDVPAETPLSRAISRDLKARGFRFCGPTIVYAWMQACGLVDDHLAACPRAEAIDGAPAVSGSSAPWRPSPASDPAPRAPKSSP
ncbi:MAG: DNA-3-methyladenine glycosylase I [Alphaproteobacteria bacterium]|nr:DNA-3-methyladenine glycosylase I [Alphaproteobacteria bacterium]